jgi:hypothetical protein
MSNFLRIDENLIHQLNNKTQFEECQTPINQQIANSLLKFYYSIQSFTMDQLLNAKLIIVCQMQDEGLEPIFGIYMIE